MKRKLLIEENDSPDVNRFSRLNNQVDNFGEGFKYQVGVIVKVVVVLLLCIYFTLKYVK